MENYETIWETGDFKVEVNFQMQTLRIKGVVYSFGIFEHIAFPMDDRFYQISKDGEMRNFKTFRQVEKLENGNFVITDL